MKEDIEEMRREHGLSPECFHCGHGRWTYEIRFGAFKCQRHSEFFLDRNLDRKNYAKSPLGKR